MTFNTIEILHDCVLVKCIAIARCAEDDKLSVNVTSQLSQLSGRHPWAINHN